MGRTLLTCALLLPVSTASARPPQAPPLRPVHAGCDCGGDASACTCGPDCACPGCANSVSAQAPGFLEERLYLIQYRRAVSQNKPLLIWVGETCPACEGKWADYVHARLSEYAGKNGTETGPVVIVARPDGLGGMTIAGRLPGIPAREQVAALCGTANSIPQPAAAPPPLLMIQRPVAPVMPMGGFGGGMPMMGGFGGGGGRMGGGGGGC